MTEIKEMAQALFLEGIRLAKRGNKVAARKQLQRALSLEPNNQRIWLYLASLAENEAQARQALNRVEALDPLNSHLPKARKWIAIKWPAVSNKSHDLMTASVISWQVKALASVIALGLIFAIGLINLGVIKGLKTIPSLAAPVLATPAPTIEQKLIDLEQLVAQSEILADKAAMISALKQIHSLSPNDDAIAAKLAQLYYEQGLTARNNGDVPTAKTAFEEAIIIQPQFQAAATEIELAELYLTGAKYHQIADWPNAIPPFEEIYRQNSTYPRVTEILYSAYFNLGMQQQAQEDLSQALISYQKAEALLPSAPEATTKIAQITDLLNPAPLPEPTPLPIGQKRVVVDITDQWAYIYEGDTLVRDFVVSTGEPGRDTAIGEFEILDKIPMAYASTWNLDMPFWLGIYWSGPLENGFHAVPTVRDTGVTMWEGYLGQRVSYGCIVLSMNDAEWLFNWVDVGTPVSITL